MKTNAALKKTAVAADPLLNYTPIAWTPELRSFEQTEGVFEVVRERFFGAGAATVAAPVGVDAA